MAQVEQETRDIFFQMYKKIITMFWLVFFHHPVKSDIRTYDCIRKIATDQGDDYTTGCLLDYPHFKDHYKIIAIDLSKQRLDANPKAIQELDFTGNLNWREGATMFFFLKK